MANDFLGQILSGVLGAGRGTPASPDGLDGPGGPGGLGGLSGPGGLGGLGGGLGGLGGGLGDVLGSVLGGGAARPGAGSAGSSPMGGQGALLAMLLPLALQWVQRNGGIGAVLDRFRQQGLGQQASSWISTGDNQPLDAQAVAEVVGMEELSRLSQQLGVPDQQVASGLADLLPQVVDQLTPGGDVPADADDVLGSGLAEIERLFGGRRGAGI